MLQRDRASGWKYAKISGHSNEALVKEYLDSNGIFADSLLSRIDSSMKKIKTTSIGGLNETSVENIIPGQRKSKSKSDLKIFYIDNTYTNISIKKSLSGQAYLVDVELFCKYFEAQFKKSIPITIKRAMSLFWSKASDAQEIITRYANRENIQNFNLQMRHNSLNAETLYSYNSSLYNAMIQWFIENAYEISFLVFATGSAKNQEDWAEYIWYINLLQEHCIDKIFSINEICEQSKNSAKQNIFYGNSNGGTTIQLPFGFVQWHKHKMQFHHQFKKIELLVSHL